MRCQFTNNSVAVYAYVVGGVDIGSSVGAGKGNAVGLLKKEKRKFQVMDVRCQL